MPSVHEELYSQLSGDSGAVQPEPPITVNPLSAPQRSTKQTENTLYLETYRFAENSSSGICVSYL